jgi:hypothetical protein
VQDLAAHAFRFREVEAAPGMGAELGVGVDGAHQVVVRATWRSQSRRSRSGLDVTRRVIQAALRVAVAPSDVPVIAASAGVTRTPS